MRRHSSAVTEPCVTNNTMATSIVGILCFEMAKTMCRLVSLYKSLTDEEIQRLKTQLTKSVGVAYLNSKDETFLLALACSERLEDLHRTASTLSRLAHKCSRYSLKQGFMDTRNLNLGFLTKSSEKIIQKMEKYVAATWVLFSEMECLHELEGREMRIQRWKETLTPEEMEETYFDTLDRRIEFQRREVLRYKQISLWNRTFDECVALMARVVCTVYARISDVFGHNVSDISASNNSPHGKKQHHLTFQIQIHIHFRWQRQVQKRVVPDTDYCLVADRDRYVSKAAPIQKNSKRVIRSRRQHFKEDIGLGLRDKPEPRVYSSAPPSTVGGSGLTLRYANVILVAERCLNSPATLRYEEREMVYKMLPARLKAAVMAKLKSNLGKAEAEGPRGGLLAAGWREAVEGMMRWLVPMAVDTMRWQGERNLVMRQNMQPKPTVLLLQTLHFSDLEKTEAAITEVLVGLSCIKRYEHGGGH